MLVLSNEDFAEGAMEAGGNMAFEDMKLPQLKEELAARGSKSSGTKPVLQRRLHGQLVEAAIARRAEAAAEDSDEAPAGTDEAEHEDASFWRAVEAAHAAAAQARRTSRS